MTVKLSEGPVSTAREAAMDYSGSWFERHPILAVYMTMALGFGIPVTLVQIFG